MQIFNTLCPDQIGLSGKTNAKTLALRRYFFVWYTILLQCVSLIKYEKVHEHYLEARSLSFLVSINILRLTDCKQFITLPDRSQMIFNVFLSPEHIYDTRFTPSKTIKVLYRISAKFYCFIARAKFCPDGVNLILGSCPIDKNTLENTCHTLKTLPVLL